MVSFFPKPYPDEILYSVLARYQIRSGNTSPKITQTELFGSPNTIATVDLPCNLNALAKNLNFVSNYTVEDLIFKNTLYPFYSVFLPPKRATQVIESMKAEYGGDIHTRTGIMASSITMPRYFRFCPRCLEEDLQNYGEVYWHRLHQIPGVIVCPVHSETLQNSIIPLQGFNKHEYHAASVENCPVISNQKTYSNETQKKLLLLAKDIDCLINSNFSSKEPDWFRRQYIALLIEKGFASATGRVYQKQLLDNFLCFYGREMLVALDSMVNGKDDCNWISSIFRKHRKAFHPVRHLLTIRFLTDSLEEFFKTDYEYKPFDKGPWLCLNAAADHYLKPVISNITITLCCDTKKPVGTFSCSCGMVYCRTGPDETDDDKRRIGKVKAYGSIWEQKLRELIEIKRLGLRETARQLHVDPRTVVRYVSLLKLETSWQSFANSEVVSFKEVSESNVNYANDIKITYRQHWKDLQKHYPEASKTTIRRLAPAIYTWLYRHDREWLNQNSPVLKIPVASRSKVNWPERDKQVLEKVKLTVHSLLSAEKPIRITSSRIAKIISLQALFEQHIEQLPLTQAYLESVTETVEDFQIRRVRWAIKCLNDSGEEVKDWKVIRIAGLGENFSDQVKLALDHELGKLSVPCPCKL